MNCQCPKPDYVMVDEQAVLLKEPFLHGKKATTECERCGRGLCWDCEAQDFEWTSDKSFSTYPSGLCQACKEDLK